MSRRWTTHGITPIGLLVVNLYPFEATVARDASWEETVENIDVGGPAMIRAAAKNHDVVTVIVDPADYGAVRGRTRRGRQCDGAGDAAAACGKGLCANGEL